MAFLAILYGMAILIVSHEGEGVIKCVRITMKGIVPAISLGRSNLVPTKKMTVCPAVTGNDVLTTPIGA